MGGRGSYSGSGGLAGRTQAQDKAIKKLVKRTANLKNEQYRIIDDNGDVVLHKKGNVHSVGLTVGEKREHLNGNISLHNHPDGGTFSSADIGDFGYGAKEIVVAAPEGTYRLINKKYGTSEQYEGWIGLREGAEKIPQQSVISLRRQAEQNLSNSKTQKSIDAINKKFESIRQSKGSEAARQFALETADKYNALSEKRRAEVSKEARRLEVQPFHDYYKANAKKFGFAYKLER